MPLLLPLAVAVLGVLAAVFVLRTRRRLRHSLYSSIRMRQEREVERARERALAPDADGRPGALQAAFGLISLAAALGLVLMGVLMAIGISR